jgi:hypothetical protein
LSKPGKNPGKTPGNNPGKLREKTGKNIRKENLGEKSGKKSCPSCPSLLLSPPASMNLSSISLSSLSSLSLPLAPLHRIVSLCPPHSSLFPLSPLAPFSPYASPSPLALLSPFPGLILRNLSFLGSNTFSEVDLEFILENLPELRSLAIAECPLLTPKILKIISQHPKPTRVPPCPYFL